jgi:hypothetical protein|tara:strand:+ start:89 stop:760 length:672 start_codon:yes stop_codon:yes gene_type:complete
MGVTGGVDMITDGLVFYVDAANPNSYISGNTTTNDLILNNVGTLINDTGFSTENNGSWTFDGSDEYIDFGGINTLNTATNLTFSFWGKKLTGDILGVESFNTTSDKIILYWWSNDRIYWGVRNTGTPTAASIIVSDFGNYHNFVGTYDGSSGTIKLYVGGSLVNTQTGAPSATTDLSGLFKIAKSNGTTFGTGQISNVKIYNRALSSGEVLQNYNALKGRFGL